MSLIRNNTRWTLSFAAFALIFAPKLGMASAGDPHDLSLEEAKSIFSDHFGADADMEKGSVRLKGFVYKACLDHLEVRSRKSTGRADFVIRDMGGLSSCVAEQKKLFPDARYGNEQVFARLSQLKQSEILSEGKDLEVGFAWEDTNVDPPKLESRSFAEPIRFVSEATRRREEMKSEAAELERQLEQCEDVARNSRGTDQKDLEALSALNILVRHGRIEDDEADSLRKGIGEERLRRLREQASRAKAEDYASIDEGLSQWASKFANGDRSQQDSIAQIRMDLAEKMSRSNPSSIETTQAALYALEELAESSEVSDAKKEFAASRAEVARGNALAAQLISSALAQATVMPMGGQPFQLQHLISMQPEFQGFVQNLQREMTDACTQANRSRGRDKSAVARCQKAQSSLASEPQRILGIAAQEVARGMAAMAPQQPQPGGYPQQNQGPNTVPYPYNGMPQQQLQSALPR
ncbi:MAG: hypothetical protein KGQ59_05210 [Bdellovibrionales bacterium]|nr:hypothetical protein [Bdellovibrionales bacterium]